MSLHEQLKHNKCRANRFITKMFILFLVVKNIRFVTLSGPEQVRQFVYFDPWSKWVIVTGSRSECVSREEARRYVISAGVSPPIVNISLENKMSV